MVLMADTDPIPKPPKRMGKMERVMLRKFTGLDPDELERTFDVSSRELAAAHDLLIQLVPEARHVRLHELAIRRMTGPGGEMAVHGECVFLMVQYLHAERVSPDETAIILTIHGLR